jgi:hypothetical protein
MVISASEWPLGHFNEEDKMFVFDNQKESGTMTIGRFAEIRTRWRINNMGWNYPIDYFLVEDKELIAVIGDSFVEALQVDVDKNFSYLLREKVYPGREVYAFGRSGAPISHYLHISRYVNKHFNPDILIFSLVHNDFDESIVDLYPDKAHFLQFSIDNDLVSEKILEPIHASSFRRIFYNSALIRYLWDNIRVDAVDMQSFRNTYFEENIRPDIITENSDLIYKAADYVVGTISNENSDRRIIFVFDAPRQAIYEGLLDQSRVLWLHDMMEEMCKKYNVEYIDLTEEMKNDFEEHNRKFNSETDGHWNEYGHEFVAEVLSKYLKD